MLNCRSNKSQVNTILHNLGMDRKMVPIATIVRKDCPDVSLVTLSKEAMSKGVNHFVFNVNYNEKKARLPFKTHIRFFHFL